MIQKSRTSTGLRSLAVVTAASFIAVPAVAESAQATAVSAAKADGPVNQEARRQYQPNRYQPGPPQVRRPKKARIVLNLNSPRKVRPGATYTWPISVTNKGKAPARGAEVSFPLPKSLKLISASMKCTWKNARVVCKVGSLKKGQTKKGTITATVAPNVRPGEAIAPKVLSKANNAKPGVAIFPNSPIEKQPGRAKAGPAQKAKHRPGKAKVRVVQPPKRKTPNRAGPPMSPPKAGPPMAGPPMNQLPRTGVPVSMMVGAGALMVWIGLVCVAVSQVGRRRRVSV